MRVGTRVRTPAGSGRVVREHEGKVLVMVGPETLWFRVEVVERVGALRG